MMTTMAPEKFLSLVEKYPKLFVKKDDPRSRISDGIECGDGWYLLIDTLCGCIQKRVDWRQKGSPEENLQPTISLIKEKFGGLRFHLDGGDEYVNGLVTMAESMSYKTCESCGNTGEKKGTGWVFTRCDSCWKKREEKRKEAGL